MAKKDLKGTWSQALFAFFGPVLVILSARWLLFEPFVIPSGSMIPTLQIHDHIVVNKLSFGIHVPFGNGFLVKWAGPRRGDVVVFRFPSDPDVFYVKRVLAVGGDEIAVDRGVVSINGNPLEQRSIPSFKDADKDKDSDDGTDNNEFEYFHEFSSKEYVVRYLQKDESSFGPERVPEGSFFVMGDNRDQSNDSRFWGVVPENLLVGRAQWIWLSCEETLSSAQFLCDPSTIRWDRLLKKVQ